MPSEGKTSDIVLGVWVLKLLGKGLRVTGVRARRWGGVRSNVDFGRVDVKETVSHSRVGENVGGDIG